MNEILAWIASHWVEWIFCLVGAGLAFFAKHYVKTQKELAEKKWQEKEKNMCGKIICTFQEKIDEVRESSQHKENKIHKELDTLRTNMENSDATISNDLNNLHKEVDTIESGILSIQGKQFRDMCEELLKQDFITIEEYEEFEEEYSVYKKLGGNHRGDALHERVVAKFDKQSSKKESE